MIEVVPYMVLHSAYLFPAIHTFLVLGKFAELFEKICFSFVHFKYLTILSIPPQQHHPSTSTSSLYIANSSSSRKYNRIFFVKS